jgi:hypothetical protein
MLYAPKTLKFNCRELTGEVFSVEITSTPVTTNKNFK